MLKRESKGINMPLVASGVAIGILMFVLMFIPIGVANNGVGYHVMANHNLYVLEEDKDDEVFDYLISEYGVSSYYNEYQQEKGIRTSQDWLLKLAITLDKWCTGDDGVFDRRFLAGLYSVMCAVAIYLWVDYLTYRRKLIPSAMIAGLTLLIFVDTAYTAYFNSFFAQAMIYNGCLIAVASLLLMHQKRKHVYGLVGLFTAGAYSLVFATQENRFLGIGLGVLGIVLIYGTKDKAVKMLMNGVSISLILVGLWGCVFSPKVLDHSNQYHAMTRGILLAADNPELALQELGIDEQYSLLAGSRYYEADALIDRESMWLSDTFYAAYTKLDVGMYYLRHPSEFNELFRLAVRQGYNVRPYQLGNYEKSAGRPAGTQTKAFTLYSQLKYKVTPITVGFVGIWMLLVIMLGIKNKFQALLMSIMIIMGLLQMALSILNVGDTQLLEASFLYAVVFDFVNLVGFAFGINKISEKWGRRTG